MQASRRGSVARSGPKRGFVMGVRCYKRAALCRGPTPNMLAHLTALQQRCHKHEPQRVRRQRLPQVFEFFFATSTVPSLPTPFPGITYLRHFIHDQILPRGLSMSTPVVLTCLLHGATTCSCYSDAPNVFASSDWHHICVVTTLCSDALGVWLCFEFL